MMQKWKAWLVLSRLTNSLMAGVGTLLGFLCVSQAEYSFPSSFYLINSHRPLWHWQDWLLGFFSISLLAASGNIHNDCEDLAIDRINRPSAPLVKGQISLRSAKLVHPLLGVVALGLAFYLGLFQGILLCLMWALLWLYNRKFKRMPLVGNLAVALLCALAIYVPEALRIPNYTLFAGIFAFLCTFAREIVKDIEDIEGDSQQGAKTLPVEFGLRSASRLASLVLQITVVLLIWAMLQRIYHWGFSLIGVVIAMLLLKLAFQLWHKPQAWRSIQSQLKIAMGLGILAIAVGMI